MGHSSVVFLVQLVSGYMECLSGSIAGVLRHNVGLRIESNSLSGAAVTARIKR
jgi:hypothetical protein